MIAELSYASRWWAWWSNPLQGIHIDHKNLLPLTNEQLANVDYFRLLQIRSTLGLLDTPDDLLESRLELRSLAMATPAHFEQHFTRFALFTLDSSILHARTQDWEANYGVNSPDLIREIITLKSEVPPELISWQEAATRYLANALKRQLFLNERIQLGFALYLRSFFPRFFSRWQLTQNSEIVQWANAIEPIPTDFWDVVNNWAAPSLEAFHKEVFSEFEIPEFDMAFDDEDNPFDDSEFNFDALTEEDDA